MRTRFVGVAALAIAVGLTPYCAADDKTKGPTPEEWEKKLREYDWINFDDMEKARATLDFSGLPVLGGQSRNIIIEVDKFYKDIGVNSQAFWKGTCSKIEIDGDK